MGRSGRIENYLKFYSDYLTKQKKGDDKENSNTHIRCSCSSDVHFIEKLNGTIQSYASVVKHPDDCSMVPIGGSFAFCRINCKLTNLGNIITTLLSLNRKLLNYNAEYMKLKYGNDITLMYGGR